MNPDLFQSDLQIPRRHVVVFCDDAFGPQSDRWVDLLPEGCHRILPVFDGGFDAALPACRPRVEAFLDAHSSRFDRASSLVVPGGEVAKNDPKVIDSVLASIHSENICRQSFVAIFGGGAVLDAVGFAASIAHRGVKVLRFPTTTLAQDDAGIGVKNGVNHHNEKNWQGVFAVPTAVINDFSLLESLSDRDWRSGFSEAVKVALLKDAREFELLEKHADAIAHRSEAESQRSIIRSAELHWRHIVEGGDPFEDEVARPLDYGHWSAHRLERLA
ncbi:MAG: 3-dehydroquinate synthase, partial [Planctomycetota bacterium]